MNKPTVFIVMGVSGSGKSTIGQLLADHLGWPYIEGDDHHSAANVLKMSRGEPLNDDDRLEWLNTLNEQATMHSVKGAVISCSALKEKYRAILRKSIKDSVRFIYLEGSFEEISKRMKERKGHFMPERLLQSQFKILEPPEDAICVSIATDPKEIIREIVSRLRQK